MTILWRHVAKGASFRWREESLGDFLDFEVFPDILNIHTNLSFPGKGKDEHSVRMGEIECQGACRFWGG